MSKITSKWIADNAIVAAHVSSAAKQSVLESKLMASYNAVINFATTAASSDTVTTEVTAAATTDTAITASFGTAKGVWAGAVTGLSDAKHAVIRQTGTNDGIDDGSGQDIYGKITESGGVWTLSYFKGSDNTAYTFAGVDNVDFYFVEVYDSYQLPVDSNLVGPLAGVLDANQATTLAGHLNGAANKHDASEIDIETDGAYYDIGDLETALSALDDQVGTNVSNISTNTTHATGDGSDHADVATNTTHSTGDGSDHADVASNTTAIGTIDQGTNYTAGSAGVIGSHLDAIDTLLGTHSSHVSGDGSDHADVATNTTHSSGDGSDHQDVADLATLSGVAANSTNLATFSGSTIPDSQTIKQALQALETAVESGTDDQTAAEVPYTPSVLTDWDGDADPGSTKDALDQLAERVDDNEIAISSNTTHATGDGSDHADVATNTTHSSGDGSDHADVATNTTAIGTIDQGTNYTAGSAGVIGSHLDAIDTLLGTHSTHVSGDGSDHADVATNTTHSSGDGSDHADVATNTTAIGTVDQGTNYTAASAGVIGSHLDAIDAKIGDIGENKIAELTLDATDISNKYKDLTGNLDVKAPSTAILHPVGGPNQDYTTDYTIITDGSYVQRVNWDGLGLDGVLEAGDKLILYYEVAA